MCSLNPLVRTILDKHPVHIQEPKLESSRREFNKISLSWTGWEGWFTEVWQFRTGHWLRKWPNFPNVKQEPAREPLNVLDQLPAYGSWKAEENAAEGCSEKRENWPAMHWKTADETIFETGRISSSEIGRTFVSERLLFRPALVFCHRRYSQRDPCVDIPYRITCHPSSAETAIRMSLFPWPSFFTPFFNSSTAFSTWGGHGSCEVRRSWFNVIEHLRVNFVYCFSLPFFLNFGAN